MMRQPKLSGLLWGLLKHPATWRHRYTHVHTGIKVEQNQRVAENLSCFQFVGDFGWKGLGNRRSIHLSYRATNLF